MQRSPALLVRSTRTHSRSVLCPPSFSCIGMAPAMKTPSPVGLAVVMMAPTSHLRQNSFFALADQGTFAVWPNGTITPLAAPPGSWGVPSAGGENGQMLAWSGEGIWIGSLQSPQVQARQIFSGSAYDPEWGPEGAHLLFFASDGLYTAAAPGYAPARVEGAPTTQPGRAPGPSGSGRGGRGGCPR